MKSMITFEEIIRKRKIYGNRYDVREIILHVDDEVFNNNHATKYNKSIQNGIQATYWKGVRDLYLPGHIMLVRLSGTHFHIEDVKKYTHFKDRRREMILHYLYWKDEEGEGVHVADAFAIMELDRESFRRVFYEFWFALGFELRFEGIVLPQENIYEIEKWSRRIETPKTYNRLISISSLILDNEHNGFHFKVISNPKYSTFVQGCLSKLQGTKGRSLKCK